MFELPSIRIGRLFGIPLEVNASWILIFLLVTVSLAFGVLPAELSGYSLPFYLVLAGLTALAFFASIVLHELAHSVVARAGGVHVERITLFMLGGVSQMDEEPHTAGREFVMAFAGPATSFLLAGLSFAIYAALATFGAPAALSFPFQWLTYVNFMVGVFNLLPGFPLDGGRVLRSILWGVTGDLDKATRWAARIGQAIGWGMVALAVVGVVVWGAVGLIWFGLIGWFVASLAGQALRQQELRSKLAKLPVRAAMAQHPMSVPGDITLEQLAHDYFLGGRHSRYPVLDAGHIIGLITLPDVKAVARVEWPVLLVRDVALRDLSHLTVDANAPLDSTVERLAGDGPGALLVVEHGHLIGIVTRADVLAVTSRIEF